MINMEVLRKFVQFKEFLLENIRKLHDEKDASGLAVFRILFGLLMLIDIPQERGMAYLDDKWGDPSKCTFPLFNFLQPLPLEYMYVVYCIMLIGSLSIMLGLFFRVGCLCFVSSYIYIFLLDKTSWNNHSYLYGLLGILLTFSNAHETWSIDSLLKDNANGCHHVPQWNYVIVRTQVFMVYFFAGIKKIDWDWLLGHSVRDLSHHWTFLPFTLLVSNDFVDKNIVHLGGFLIDISAGFFLFVPSLRKYAFFFCGSFNLMNSQIFNIGMFPYMMLAAMPIFCAPDWPKSFFPKISFFKNKFKRSKESPLKRQVKKSLTGKEIFKTICLILYVAIQCMLPFTHSLTKGYNNWTNGLYGYSWDMMVHSWHRLHVKVTIKDKLSGRITYLNPDAWANNGRWFSHADMVKQFAICVQEKMHHRNNITDIELYVDAWHSLNGRFIQRMFDPRIDIITAKWSPFEEVSWLLPLLTDLSDWRSQMKILNFKNLKDENDITFVADFPGLSLTDYVDSKFKSSSLQILSGDVEISLDNGTSTNLKENDSIELPVGKFYTISPMKQKPACYMYIHTFQEAANKGHLNGGDKNKPKQSFWEKKYEALSRCARKTFEAWKSIFRQEEMISK